MNQREIKIIKQDTRYILSDGEYTISAVVSGDGKHISIFRQQFYNQGFEFNGSEKETVEAIAKLFLEAIKLK